MTLITLITEGYFKNRKSKVLDERTKNSVELDLLEKVVDHSITETGRSVLYHSLNNPSISLKNIKKKQDSLKELRANDKLRQGVVDLLARVKKYEDDSLKFLGIRPSFSCGSYGSKYSTLPYIRELICGLSSWAQELPEPETPYLKQLKEDILSLKGSGVEKLAKGPIFRKLFKKEVIGLMEIGKGNFLISPFPYYNLPTKIGQISLGGGAGFIPLVYAINSGSSPENMFVSGIFPFIGAFTGYGVGSMRDRSNFHTPMKERFLNEKEAQDAYRAIGSLDELISFDEFGKEMKFSTIPEIVDEEKDFFEATSFINPVQFKGVIDNEYDILDHICNKRVLVKPIRNYVPNDIIIGNGTTLKFLTGSNSGGKTSAAKAITQSRILAQSGCYIPAQKAKANIAHQLHYQIGENDSQASEEGGLGTQFLQTKNILFNGNQRSFVVIDDLIEGTTIEEKLNHTRNQIYGFLHKGINVLYITHHHELANEFRERGVGSYSQVEFDGENPTHRIIPGISTNSHSDVVARRVGFDEQAIREHLIFNGYLNPKQKLNEIKEYQTSK